MEDPNTSQPDLVMRAIGALQASLASLREEQNRHRDEDRRALAELRREVSAQLQHQPGTGSSRQSTGHRGALHPPSRSGETTEGTSEGGTASAADLSLQAPAETENDNRQQILPSGDANEQLALASQKMIVKLDTYDGRSPWNAFQVHFDLVADLNDWTTASRGAFLASTLRGPALELLQNLPPGNQRDYKALEEALEGRFGEKHLGRLYHATLRTRIQGRNESLSELAIDIERLTRLSYQGCTTATLDSVAVGHFLDAIGDTEVQQFVRLSSPACMRDAVARAMEVEATTRAVRATRRVTVPGGYQPGTSSALHPVPLLNTDRQTSHEATGMPPHQRPSPTCWRCGQKGHIQRYCSWRSKEEKGYSTPEN